MELYLVICKGSGLFAWFTRLAQRLHLLKYSDVTHLALAQTEGLAISIVSPAIEAVIGQGVIHHHIFDLLGRYNDGETVLAVPIRMDAALATERWKFACSQIGQAYGVKRLSVGQAALAGIGWSWAWLFFGNTSAKQFCSKLVAQTLQIEDAYALLPAAVCAVLDKDDRLDWGKAVNLQ